MRILVGAITTMVFLGSGMSVLGGGGVLTGSVLIGLGLFRGVHWVREVWWEFGPDDDEDE